MIARYGLLDGVFAGVLRAGEDPFVSKQPQSGGGATRRKSLATVADVVDHAAYGHCLRLSDPRELAAAPFSTDVAAMGTSVRVGRFTPDRERS